MKTILFALGILALPAAAFAQSSPAPSPAAVSPSPSPTPTPAPKAFTLNGFADTGIVSASAASRTNAITGRVFDTLSGQPQFHNLNLTATQTGTIGGKIELSAGDDADVINSYPKFGAQSELDITQAYLSLGAGRFTLIGGKFESLAGAEVIESPSNLDFSRSILFGFAVPFTHTGARLTYAATPQVSLIAGLNKGWDTTRTVAANGDNNRLTAEYGVAWNPGKALSLTAQSYSGIVEPADLAANQRRSLVDLVATYHLNDKLQFVANYDTGSQTNTALLNGAGTVINASGKPAWNGLAGYVSDALTAKLSA
ncbi:MAG TPA: outer membrane beta-barrel protein, partial [Caballeronia sp.]|nr:outer membrane beta-barrel protein [Caballeronia sp.]